MRQLPGRGLLSNGIQSVQLTCQLVFLARHNCTTAAAQRQTFVKSRSCDVAAPAHTFFLLQRHGVPLCPRMHHNMAYALRCSPARARASYQCAAPLSVPPPNRFQVCERTRLKSWVQIRSRARTRTNRILFIFRCPACRSLSTARLIVPFAILRQSASLTLYFARMSQYMPGLAVPPVSSSIPVSSNLLLIQK